MPSHVCILIHLIRYPRVERQRKDIITPELCLPVAFLCSLQQLMVTSCCQVTLAVLWPLICMDFDLNDQRETASFDLSTHCSSILLFTADGCNHQRCWDFIQKLCIILLYKISLKCSKTKASLNICLVYVIEPLFATQFH